MRTPWVPVLCGLTLACSGAKPEAESSTGAEPADAEAARAEPQKKAPAGPPAGAWVLIDETRGLFRAPERDAGPVVDPASAGLRLAEVVGLVEDRIEVRTIAADPQLGCARASGFDFDFELHMYADPAALRQVLTRPKIVELPDGAKLELAPGVPVTKTGAEGELLVGENTLHVAVAEDEVGTWFSRPDAPSPPGDPGLHERVIGKVLRYGEHELRGGVPPFITGLPGEPVDEGTLMTFTDACGRFTLRVTGDPNDGEFDPDMVARNAGLLALMDQQNSSGGSIPHGEAFGDTDRPGTWVVRPLTPLAWAEGEGAAGHVVREAELRDAVERDGELCFAVTTAQVCVDASKAEHREPTIEDLGLVRGAGFGGKGRPVPKILHGEASVGDGLDESIVRRIIRAHANELRHCYNLGLDERPELAGWVSIAFSIGQTGTVATAKVADDVLAPAGSGVGECIARAVQRWKFPGPAGGVTVSVVYPFYFSPG